MVEEDPEAKQFKDQEDQKEKLQELADEMIELGISLVQKEEINFQELLGMGCGGGSEVWRGEWEGEVYAVKLWNKDSGLDPLKMAYAFYTEYKQVM